MVCVATRWDRQQACASFSNRAGRAARAKRPDACPKSCRWSQSSAGRPASPWCAPTGANGFPSTSCDACAAWVATGPRRATSHVRRSGWAWRSTHTASSPSDCARRRRFPASCTGTHTILLSCAVSSGAASSSTTRRVGHTRAIGRNSTARLPACASACSQVRHSSRAVRAPLCGASSWKICAMQKARLLLSRSPRF